MIKLSPPILCLLPFLLDLACLIRLSPINSHPKHNLTVNISVDHTATYTPKIFKNSIIKKSKNTHLQLITKQKIINVLNVPDVFQSANNGCGPSSLLAVLDYYSIFDYHESQIAVLTESNENGTSPYNIAKAALNLGLNATVEQNMTQTALQQLLNKNIPVIVLIQAWKEDWDPHYTENDNTHGHYVVVIGYDDHTYFIEDPWILGSITVLSKNLFQLRWHDHVSSENRVMSHVGIVVVGSRKDIETVKQLQ